MTNTAPRVLIEDWLPIAELGIESRRESAPIPGQFPKLKTLHVWFARRPLAASAGVVLAGLLPCWSSDLAAALPDAPQLQSEQAYRRWYMHLLGIWGDPVRARREIVEAKAQGIKLKDNPYSYRPAFKNSVGREDIDLLHRVLVHAWGRLPTVADVTAGGGSIPWVSLRYGLPTIANDLNPVAASVLRASLEFPTRFGSGLVEHLETWGRLLVERAEAELSPYFPRRPNEIITNYLYAHAIACPRTGRLVPLMPDWWLRRDPNPSAVRLVIADEGGNPIDPPRFEVLHGTDINFDPAEGNFAQGRAISPYDDLVIDGDYIKEQARLGNMVTLPYAVVVKNASGRSFRAPNADDLAALAAAEVRVSDQLADWKRRGIVPDQEIDDISNYDRGHRMYGIREWVDFYSPRQLLTHATFVEQFLALVPEVRAALGDDLGNAVLSELALMQGKALNYNSRQTSWNVNRQSTRSVFEKHNFAFKWTFVEFPGPVELLPWCLRQLIDAYAEVSALLEETGRGNMSAALIPRSVVVSEGTAADLPHVSDRSVEYVCVDPPYYANVMYAELSDFFYVWERLTLGAVGIGTFTDSLTDKANEAVTNLARFTSAGRRKKDLADLDYEAKMAAIFRESRRILTDNGVLTVMFTNKDARAWDALGSALIDAGFSVETSWPVATEPEASSHQANKSAAESTVMLVCRKRPDSASKPVYLEDLEGEIRAVAREAYERFASEGIAGVDLLLSTYGPALSVVSRAWPVYSANADEGGGDQLLRPEQALDLARQEIVRLRHRQLVGRAAHIDRYSDFVLIAWDVFGTRSFDADSARLLAMAVGGLSLKELEAARILTVKNDKASLNTPAERLRRDADSKLPGVRLEADGFDFAIDAVDTVLYVTQHDGLAAAKRIMDRHGLIGEPRFEATVQGLINAIPRVKVKGTWVVSEAGLLEALSVAYLPSIAIPDDAPAMPVEEQGDLLADLGN